LSPDFHDTLSASSEEGAPQDLADAAWLEEIGDAEMRRVGRIEVASTAPVSPGERGAGVV
jgi:hypothetical protein